MLRSRNAIANAAKPLAEGRHWSPNKWTRTKPNCATAAPHPKPNTKQVR